MVWRKAIPIRLRCVTNGAEGCFWCGEYTAYRLRSALRSRPRKQTQRSRQRPPPGPAPRPPCKPIHKLNTVIRNASAFSGVCLSNCFFKAHPGAWCRSVGPVLGECVENIKAHSLRAHSRHSSADRQGEPPLCAAQAQVHGGVVEKKGLLLL